MTLNRKTTACDVTTDAFILLVVLLTLFCTEQGIKERLYWRIFIAQYRFGTGLLEPGIGTPGLWLEPGIPGTGIKP